MSIIKVAPLPFLTVTGPFGVTRQTSSGPKVHKGVDLRAREPTEVRCPFDGTVIMADDHDDPDDVDDAGGLELLVRGDNGWTAGFAHLSDIGVFVGERVNAGDVIAISGASAFSSEHGVDPHLHMSLRKPKNADGTAGELVDPMTEMPGAGRLVLVVGGVLALGATAYGLWRVWRA